MKLLISALLVVGVLACTPELPPNGPPSPPPTDRDGIGTPIGDACAQLRRLGCPEGWPSRRGRTCFESYTDAAKLASVPATCLKAAATEADVRACGGPNDVRVRCILPSVWNDGSRAP